MDNNEVEKCLRETFSIVNQRASLATDKILEDTMNAAFQDGGVGWLLDTARRFKVCDTEYFRHNIAAFLSHIKTKEGVAELERYVAAKQDKVKQYRRKIVQIMHVSDFGERGTEFNLDSLADNGGIYRMLMDTPASQDEKGGKQNNERYRN